MTAAFAAAMKQIWCGFPGFKEAVKQIRCRYATGVKASRISSFSKQFPLTDVILGLVPRI